jgi:hypothetical protein
MRQHHCNPHAKHHADMSKGCHKEPPKYVVTQTPDAYRPKARAEWGTHKATGEQALSCGPNSHQIEIEVEIEIAYNIH